MLRIFSPLAKGGAFVFAALLAVSPAVAQPSALGHVPAPGSYPVYAPDGSTLHIYPGDKGFHSTMQIQNYYQTLARLAPVAVPARVAPPRYRVSRVAAAPTVVVSIGEPASKPVVVAVRGPDGRVRSFAMAGGQDVIQPRTIVVHPGESLTIRFDGARAELPRKQ